MLQDHRRKRSPTDCTSAISRGFGCGYRWSFVLGNPAEAQGISLEILFRLCWLCCCWRSCLISVSTIRDPRPVVLVSSFGNRAECRRASLGILIGSCWGYFGGRAACRGKSLTMLFRSCLLWCLLQPYQIPLPIVGDDRPTVLVSFSAAVSNVGSADNDSHPTILFALCSAAVSNAGVCRWGSHPVMRWFFRWPYRMPGVTLGILSRSYRVAVSDRAGLR